MQTLSGQTVNKETGEIEWKPFIKTPFNFDRDDASLATGLACEDETLAQQQFKEECDINTILERFGQTGEVPTNVRQPLDMDFIEAYDFQSAQNALVEAQQAFDAMPAKVRERFKNDPAEFIEFFQLEENRAEGERLGLINPRPAPIEAPNGPTGGQTGAAAGAPPSDT